MRTRVNLSSQTVGSGSKKAGSLGTMSSQSSQSVASSKNAEKLEVTVIPVDDFPYSKIIQIPHSMLGKLFRSKCDRKLATCNLKPILPERILSRRLPPWRCLILSKRRSSRTDPLPQPERPISKRGSAVEANLRKPRGAQQAAFVQHFQEENRAQNRHPDGN